MTDTTPKAVRLDSQLAEYKARLRSWRYRQSQPDPDGFEAHSSAIDAYQKVKAEEYLRQAWSDDTHSSDVEPQAESNS